MQASAMMASFVYNGAKREEMLPRKPLPEPQTRTGTIPDVPYTKVGDVTLTLDAYVPEGDGPFPAAILVHGGGFSKCVNNTYATPLFDPLTASALPQLTIYSR